MNLSAVANEVVAAILRDLNSRKGLSHTWDSIDEDIQGEIIGEWREAVIAVLRDAVSASGGRENG